MMLLAAIQWHTFFFLLFSLLTCGFALAVVFSSNVVRMAFFLTISLGAAAGLFFLAGAEFVGAMQFMIYVGGTLVLLIFGVMLTAHERFISMKTKAGEWVMAAFLGGGLFLLLVRATLMVPQWNAPNLQRDQVAQSEVHDSAAIGAAVSAYRADSLPSSSAPPAAAVPAGKSVYLLPFEIVSVHLLVVLIGAGYLARAKKRNPGNAWQA